MKNIHIVCGRNSTSRNVRLGAEKHKNILRNTFAKAKKNKKDLKFPSLSEWLNKLCYIHAMKYMKFINMGRPALAS